MNQRFEKLYRITILVLIALTLNACDTWLGEEEVPLPGERIPVLLQDTSLTPDPDLSIDNILLPAPSYNPNWPQSGGYANHAMHHIKGEQTLRHVWSSNIGAGSDDYDRITSQPVIDEGRIFTMDSKSVVAAVDIKNGETLWNLDLTNDDEDEGHIAGGLAYYRGTIYATTGFAEVHAIDAKSGKSLWMRNLGTPMRAAPTVRHGMVYVVTLENKLFALDYKTGQTRWTYAGIIEEASILGSASPAIDNGIVIAAFTSGEIAAIRADNGRVLWTETLSIHNRTEGIGLLNHIRGNPVVDRGLVFVINHSGSMAALNLRTGFRLWEQNIGSFNTPWVVGDYVYVATSNSELVCLSRNTGSIYWVTALPRWTDPDEKKGSIIWSGPILVSDRLIIAGSHGSAIALSPYTGRIVESIVLPDPVNIAPSVANGTIFFITASADLVAYR